MRRARFTGIPQRIGITWSSVGDFAALVLVGTLGVEHGSLKASHLCPSFGLDV
jgi:hypothetical protein